MRHVSIREGTGHAITITNLWDRPQYVFTADAWSFNSVLVFISDVAMSNLVMIFLPEWSCSSFCCHRCQYGKGDAEIVKAA